MLAGIGSALVDGVSDVDAVTQQLVEEALVDGIASPAADALGGEGAGEGGGRSPLGQKTETAEKPMSWVGSDSRA